MNLNELSYDELLEYKQNAVDQAIHDGTFNRLRALAFELGQRIYLPKRETTLCYSWEIAHPAIGRGMIKVTATEGPGEWNPTLKAFEPKRSIRVCIGTGGKPFQGRIVALYAAHISPDDWIYVPGEWEKNLKLYIEKAQARIEKRKADLTDTARQELLERLHVGEGL